MPLAVNEGPIIVAAEPPQLLGGLPVPHKEPPFAVPGCHVPPIGGKRHLARKTRGRVALEHFLAQAAKPVAGPVDMDLVVHGVGSPVLLGRVQPGRGHGVHGGVGNVLHGHRQAVLPDQDFLVVGSRHEPFPVVREQHLSVDDETSTGRWDR